MKPYRAIPIGQKDFVFGWYFERGGGSYIIPITDKYHTPASFVLTFVSVIPETVSQATGRKDRDKKDIYQGDIMEWYNACVTKGQNAICRTTVKWNNLHSRYEGIVRTGHIIGTIHTTPGLMEGK